MARLRLSHTKLKAHLFRFGLINNHNCILCKIPEDIDHYLLNCHSFHSHRCELRQELINMNKDIKYRNITRWGGGNTDKLVKEMIAKAEERYIRNTGKASDI